MNFFTFTLLADGTSDRALLPHLSWLLRTNGVTRPVVPQWADLSRLRDRPKGLIERIKASIDLYPCELLFVHRDAERETTEKRRNEISKAIKTLIGSGDSFPYVCVIPVRMHEAWLLFEESALRRAAGNPNGAIEINLPSLKKVESLADPKVNLHNLLRAASERTGRRLRQFNVHHCAGQISEFIEDFSPLRKLTAFTELESEVQKAIANSGW